MLRASLRLAGLLMLATTAVLLGAPADRAEALPTVFCSNGGINLVTTGCISGTSSAYTPNTDGYYSNANGGDPEAKVEEAIFLATGVHVDISLYGKSDDNPGLFSIVGTSTSGIWTVLDHTLISYITVKAANSFALYEFNPATFIGTWTTAGILDNGGQQPGVSHISFWTTGGQQVPEPAGLALFGAALAGLALTYRRRRAL